MIDRSRYIKIFVENQNDNIRDSTITAKIVSLKKLFNYLEENNFNNLFEIEKNDIYDFINSIDYATQTVSKLKFVLREFFNIMYSMHLSNFNGDSIFPIIFTNKRNRIMSYYSPDEIKIMIDNIDTDFKCGIRDKCMIVLLTQTGLRASDVVWLRFNEINWDKQVICKRQIKTNQPVIVPFTDQARYLLIDYIKNHRKSPDNEFIFINSNTLKPFKSASILTGICRKNFIKAEISIINRKAGCHSLRHSLATNLLKENTPMPVITGILGHKSVETTERYISIDIEGLRQVSLEVPYD